MYVAGTDVLASRQACYGADAGTLGHADSELETAQHFLDPRSGLEDALYELHRSGQILFESWLDLFGRKDESPILNRVGS